MKTVSSLTPTQLVFIRDVLQKWAIGTCKRDIPIPDIFIRCLFRMESQPVWTQVRNRLPFVTSPEAYLSAGLAFIGIGVYRSIVGSNRKGKDDLQRDINVVLLYIGSDYYLDDPNVDKESKDAMKRSVSKSLKGELVTEEEDKSGLSGIVAETLALTPGCRDSLIKAWKSELNSLRQLEETDYETLLEISKDKGTTTVQMACAIINGGEMLEGAKELGPVTQFIDDLMDYHSDIRDGINTAATVDPERFVYDLVASIDGLPSIFWLLKILYIQVVCSTVESLGIFSRELTGLCDGYRWERTPKDPIWLVNSTG